MPCGHVSFSVAFILCYCACTFYGQITPIELNENNWIDTLNDEWMILFYSPTKECHAIQEIWSDFALNSPNLGNKVGQVDVTSSPTLSARFVASSTPVVIHVVDGQFRHYSAPVTKELLTGFIQDKLWRHIKPIPDWKAPDTTNLSLLSNIYKVLNTVEQHYNKIINDSGLPIWVTSLIIRLITITIDIFIIWGVIYLIKIYYRYTSNINLDTPTKKKKNKKKKKPKNNQKGNVNRKDTVDKIEEENMNSQLDTNDVEEIKSNPDVTKSLNDQIDENSAEEALKNTPEEFDKCISKIDEKNVSNKKIKDKYIEGNLECNSKNGSEQANKNQKVTNKQNVKQTCDAKPRKQKCRRDI